MEDEEEQRQQQEGRLMESEDKLKDAKAARTRAEDDPIKTDIELDKVRSSTVVAVVVIIIYS